MTWWFFYAVALIVTAVMAAVAPDYQSFIMGGIAGVMCTVAWCDV